MKRKETNFDKLEEGSKRAKGESKEEQTTPKKKPPRKQRPRKYLGGDKPVWMVFPELNTWLAYFPTFMDKVRSPRRSPRRLGACAGPLIVFGWC